MTNLSQIYNSGSLYEQLISQVIAVESQPRLKLVAEKTEQGVYKGVLSDFASRASTLNALLDKLADPLRSSFESKAATVGAGAGFKASASDDATTSTYQVQVTQLAQADARLSQRFDAMADAPATGTMSFTIHVAQPEGDPVDLVVNYSQPSGETLGDALVGIAAAINESMAAAEADGQLAEGTGVGASVIRETTGTARLSLRSEATGYANRLTFTDTSGLLGLLQVDRETAQTGTGGGAVYAVGTGPEDSALSASMILDGLTIFRDTNAIDDAIDGVTLTLSTVTDAPAALTIGADTKGMRAEVEAFVSAYNGLMSFLTDKSRVDAEAGTRGTLASDSTVRDLRANLRSDLFRESSAGGTFSRLADLGIETQRDGTLKISDSGALDEALRTSPGAVGSLFAGEDGLASRLADRIGGLLGPTGTIEQRKKGSDDRVQRLDGRIDRMRARLQTREDMLRAQFAQLQEITTRAESQFSSLSNLFY